MGVLGAFGAGGGRFACSRFFFSGELKLAMGNCGQPGRWPNTRAAVRGHLPNWKIESTIGSKMTINQKAAGKAGLPKTNHRTGLPGLGDWETVEDPSLRRDVKAHSPSEPPEFSGSRSVF